MISGLRFQGNFNVEKKYLTPEQVKKLDKIPGKPTTILNDEDLLLLMAKNENDDTISKYFRANGISYTWGLPAERHLITPVQSGPKLGTRP